jgi:membrane associated rhomboid family serine protease
MTSPSSGTVPTPGQPEPGGRRRRAAEIDVDEARKAFFLMVGFIGVIWILQIANWADHYDLDASYGILPRSLGHLGAIFTAPFLHFSWDHIEGNSGRRDARRGGHQWPGGVAVPGQ